MCWIVLAGLVLFPFGRSAGTEPGAVATGCSQHTHFTQTPRRYHSRFRTASTQNAELDQLVNTLQTKYNRLGSLAADFTQIYTPTSGSARRESGRLLLKKPGRMRWDYTAPEAKLFISDGRWLYEYIAGERFATRTAVKESDDLRAPFLFLLGRGNLRRDFKTIEFAQESPARAGHRVLRLVPKRATDFKELLLEIAPDTLQLSRLTLIEAGGARSDFLFTNLRENVPLAEAQFKPPPGIEVRAN